MSPEFRPPPFIDALDFSREDVHQARINGTLLTISPMLPRTCNLRCRHCYTSAGKPDADNLSLDEIKSIVVQAKALGARTVRIAGHGEPLLWPDIWELIDFVTDCGMKTMFFTNGTMIGHKEAEWLLTRPVSLIVKFNSKKPEIQDYICGRRGAFQKIQAGIQALLDVGFNTSNPYRMGIESGIFPQNYEELPDIYRWARDHSIIPYFELTMHGGRGAINEEMHVTREQARRLFELLLEIDQTEYGYTWFPSPPYVGFPCDKLFYNVVVNHNGTVQPCYGINIPLGNVRVEPLSQIMRSPILRDLRSLDRMHGNCGACALHDKCYFGCRCDAFCHGDVFGSYHMCWHYPVDEFALQEQK
ncbi:MAG: radical SAM protein [Anaerolineales bacterium]